MKALAFGLALFAAPAMAQEVDHSHHDKGATVPMQVERKPRQSPDPMAATPGTDLSAAPSALDADSVGNEAPPPLPTDHAADRFFPPERMAMSRMDMMHEDRFSTASVRIDQLEYRAVSGQDGYGWKGQAWFGGDIDRFAITSEGEGTLHHAPERAELAALWRHAIGPWFNLEAGVRHDFRPDLERTYVAIGIEGLAPYWIEVESQLFVSNMGDIHARLAASTDERITNRLILQPDIEINAALQDVPELGIGAGLDRLELGARLRYEFVSEFAPYVGVHWERRFGRSADYARALGEGPSAVSAVIGLRTWF